MIAAFQAGQLGRGGSVAAIVDPSYLWTTTAATTPGGTTLSSGNRTLNWAVAGSANTIAFRSATALSGKVYCEFACVTAPATMTHGFGVQVTPPGSIFNPATNGGVMASGNGGCGLPSAYYQNGASRTSSGSYAFATGDRIGIAFDVTSRKLWFSKNGTWISGDPATDTSPTMTLAGGTVFYFTVGAYSCSIASGTYQYEIYPSAASQNYAAPSGFSTYQP